MGKKFIKTETVDLDGHILTRSEEDREKSLTRTNIGLTVMKNYGIMELRLNLSIMRWAPQNVVGEPLIVKIVT